MCNKDVNRRQFFKNAMATGATVAGCGLFAGVFQAGEASASAPLRPPGAVPEDEFSSRCIRCLRCVEACPNNAILSLDNSFGRHRRNTPAIKARRQACMLCNRIEGDYLKCTEACPSGALQPIRNDPDEIRRKVSMGTARIDPDLCYSYSKIDTGALFALDDAAFRQRSLDLAASSSRTGPPESTDNQYLWTCGACASACPLQGIALSRGMWERPEVNAEACLGCGLCERACIRYPQAIRVKPEGT